MKDLVLRKNAFKIATICANVQKGEKVTIVTDFNKVDLAESIASCCLELQAEVVITVMEPRKMHNQKLPEAVAAAMAASDVLFVPTTWSIAHTEARTMACKAGARVINLPALERETLISGAIDLDFVVNEPLVKKVADLLTKAKIARVTTDIGTDITMS
ncbi:MAG TPA: aminopeptidase, partial [Bacillota bacterium]|nr:aminopeptidase [Bacillota bacterium]